MAGLARLCKMYGSMEVSDAYGNKLVWIWDYVNDKARLKNEMTKEEIDASEKAKWMSVKDQLDAKKVNNMTKKSKNKTATEVNTVLAAVPYQCCPLCNGNGQTVADWFISSVYQTCKVCNGEMIIPMHIVDWRLAVKEA